jgi:hypothetical protein
MMKTLILAGLLTFSLSTGHVLAQDQIDLEGARIFGNRDLPNITYIVPWKDDKLELMEVQPIGTLFDEALLPIDRDVFIREVEYYELLQGKQE